MMNWKDMAIKGGASFEGSVLAFAWYDRVQLWKPEPQWNNGWFFNQQYTLLIKGENEEKVK
jgi:hypothetical protein